MKSILFLIAFITPFHSFSQTDTTMLIKYLNEHATVFDLSDKPDAVINRLMKDKKLFIYGQGASHALVCNLTIPDKVVKSLSQIKDRKLKYYFIEWGRSMAYLQNLVLKGDNISAFKIFQHNGHEEPFWDVYLGEVDTMRNFFGSTPSFEYIGIDFERARSFHIAVDHILTGIQVNNTLLKKCTDTAHYFHLASEMYKQEKEFVKYYKQLRKEFYNDSSHVKNAIGNNDRFEALRNIMTNENVKSRYQERNTPMTKNIITTFKNTNAGDMSFLCIGMAHSLLKYNFSVASRLNKNPGLKDNIIVMNLYCQDCRIHGEPLSNYDLDHCMKHDEIRFFQMAAAGKGEMVLFDLTHLPKEFEYLKDCGDLMLFAKNQNQ